MCSFNKRLLSACFVADTLLGHSGEVTGLLCSTGADVGRSRQHTKLSSDAHGVHTRRAERTAGGLERQTWGLRVVGPRGDCRAWGQPHLLHEGLRWLSALPAVSVCFSGDLIRVKMPTLSPSSLLGTRRALSWWFVSEPGGSAHRRWASGGGAMLRASLSPRLLTGMLV